jgi:hypothetical protein
MMEGASPIQGVADNLATELARPLASKPVADVLTGVVDDLAVGCGADFVLAGGAGLWLVDAVVVAVVASFLLEAVRTALTSLIAVPNGVSGEVGGASAAPANAGWSDRERARRGT